MSEIVLAAIATAVAPIAIYTVNRCFCRKPKTKHTQLRLLETTEEDPSPDQFLVKPQVVAVQHNCVHFRFKRGKNADLETLKRLKFELLVKQLGENNEHKVDVTSFVLGQKIATVDMLSSNSNHQVTLRVVNEDGETEEEHHDRFETTNGRQQDLLKLGVEACKEGASLEPLISKVKELLKSSAAMIAAARATNELLQGINIMNRGDVGSGKSCLNSFLLSLFSSWNPNVFAFMNSNSTDGTVEDKIAQITEHLWVKDQVGEVNGSRYNEDNTDVTSFGEIRWMHNGNYVKVVPQPAEHINKKGHIALVVLSANPLSPAAVEQAKKWITKLSKHVPVFVAVTQIDRIPEVAELNMKNQKVSSMCAFHGSNIQEELIAALDLPGVDVHFISCITSVQEFEMIDCNHLQKVNSLMKKIMALQLVEAMLKQLCSKHGVAIPQPLLEQQAAPKVGEGNEILNAMPKATTVAPDM